MPSIVAKGHSIVDKVGDDYKTFKPGESIKLSEDTVKKFTDLGFIDPEDVKKDGDDNGSDVANNGGGNSAQTSSISGSNGNISNGSSSKAGR